MDLGKGFQYSWIHQVMHLEFPIHRNSSNEIFNIWTGLKPQDWLSVCIQFDLTSLPLLLKHWLERRLALWIYLSGHLKYFLILLLLLLSCFVIRLARNKTNSKWCLRYKNRWAPTDEIRSVFVISKQSRIRASSDHVFQIELTLDLRPLRCISIRFDRL